MVIVMICVVILCYTDMVNESIVIVMLHIYLILMHISCYIIVSYLSHVDVSYHAIFMHHIYLIVVYHIYPLCHIAPSYLISPYSHTNCPIRIDLPALVLSVYTVDGDNTYDAVHVASAAQSLLAADGDAPAVERLAAPQSWSQLIGPPAPDAMY